MGDGHDERRQRRIAFALLVLTFLIWSNSFIAARALVGDGVPAAERLDPLRFVEARFAPVALFCLAWFAVSPSGRRTARQLVTRHPLRTAVLASVNVWGYNLAFGAGHHRVAAGSASLIIALNPVLTYLLVLAICQERPAWVKNAGLLMAFTGIYVVVVYGAGQAVEAAYLTDALILIGAPVSWTLYTVLSKPLLEGRSPLELTLFFLGLGSLPALAAALGDRGLHARLATWEAERYGAALFLALACSLLAFWLWFEALKRLPASTAAAFVFLNPPLTLFFEWLWFGRAPNAGLIAGGAIVLAGVWLCSRPTSPRGA